MQSNESMKERMRKIASDLERGIRDVFESGRYEAYLKTMGRFHRYSMSNTVLIYMQKPDATLIAGYRSWQDRFRRHVLKGEKGIRILAPCPYKKTVTADVFDGNMLPVLDAEGNQARSAREITVPAFRPVTVFDVSQTDGDPLPELAKMLTGSVDRYPEFLEALRRASAVPILFEDLPSGTDGFFSFRDKMIGIRKGMSEAQTVCAAIHEIAHSRLHCPADGAAREKSGRTMEVEAESVAYAVCAYYGIETGENSFGYIASWSKDRSLPELKQSLETIVRAASGMIGDIGRAVEELDRAGPPERGESSVEERLLTFRRESERTEPGREACL